MELTIKDVRKCGFSHKELFEVLATGVILQSETIHKYLVTCVQLLGDADFDIVECGLYKRYLDGFKVMDPGTFPSRKRYRSSRLLLPYRLINDWTLLIIPIKSKSPIQWYTPSGAPEDPKVKTRIAELANLLIGQEAKRHVMIVEPTIMPKKSDSSILILYTAWMLLQGSQLGGTLRSKYLLYCRLSICRQLLTANFKESIETIVISPEQYETRASACKSLICNLFGIKQGKRVRMSTAPQFSVTSDPFLVERAVQVKPNAQVEPKNAQVKPNAQVEPKNAQVEPKNAQVKRSALVKEDSHAKPPVSDAQVKPNAQVEPKNAQVEPKNAQVKRSALVKKDSHAKPPVL